MHIGSSARGSFCTFLLALLGIHLAAGEAFAQRLYWTGFRDGRIYRASTTGGDDLPILSGRDLLERLDVDTINEKVYWVERGKIGVANLGGTCVDTVIDGLINPFAIAVDAGAGKLYFSERVNGGQISRVDTDGMNLEVIVPDTGDVFGIAVDPDGGKIYWTESGDGRVGRSNLDGTAVDYIIPDAPGGVGLADIELDVAAGLLYYVNTGNGEIRFANLDGSMDEVFLRRSTSNIALDLESEVVFWTVSSCCASEYVWRANFDGSDQTEVVRYPEPIPGPWGIEIDPRTSTLEEATAIDALTAGGTAEAGLLLGPNATWGDVDNDFDRDLADFAALQYCIVADGELVDPSIRLLCSRYDADCDFDVDINDAALFLGVMTDVR